MQQSQTEGLAWPKRSCCLSAIEKDWTAFQTASIEVRSDRHITLQAVLKSKGRALQYASSSLQCDVCVVMVALLQDGDMLEHASKDLQSDVCIVMAAISSNPAALRHAPPSLQNDSFLQEFANHWMRNGKHQGERLAAEEEECSCSKRRRLMTTFASLLSGERAFDGLDAGLQDERCIAMAAVLRKAENLQHVSEKLREDQAIVMAAVASEGNTLKYAAAAFRDDEFVVLVAMQTGNWLKHTDAVQHASLRIRASRPFMLAALSEDASLLQYASEELRSDAALVMAVVSREGCALRFASSALRNNAAIVTAAVSSDPLALEYASEALCGDPAIVLAAIRCRNAICFDDGTPGFMSRVSESGALAFKHAAPHLRHDRNFMLTAVAVDCRVLESAGRELLEDEEFQSQVAEVAGPIICFEISMLSGARSVRICFRCPGDWPLGVLPASARTRVRVGPLGSNVMAGVREICAAELEIPFDRRDKFELLLGEHQLPRDWPNTECPGVVTGKVLQLQLVV